MILAFITDLIRVLVKHVFYLKLQIRLFWPNNCSSQKMVREMYKEWEQCIYRVAQLGKLVRIKSGEALLVPFPFAFVLNESNTPPTFLSRPSWFDLC